ncbi:MAG: tetratricopeptide repeat protein [Candidatus Competibacteraceae bacterium]|jgi:Ca-activated chloride channel family protein|nr:tetratricopeptide repeat protein [Candidatus Competibacteraceae bacterium]
MNNDLVRLGIRRTVIMALFVFSAQVHAAGFVDLWLTPDQQGQRLFNQGRFAAAAERFTDPMRRGTALYRAGAFEAAATAFARVDSADAAFNRGNALILLGSYEQAILAFQRALQLKPGWSAAETNLAIAEARLQALAPPEDDAGGTGGRLEADEVVIDNSGRTDKSEQQQVEEGGQARSDEELRALWMRRVQTRPADFLKVRFSQQLAKREMEQGDQ